MSTIRTNNIKSLNDVNREVESLVDDPTLYERGFAQQVDSVSDLRSASFPASLQRLWLSGYYGVGTTGGGPLYRDSDDTTTEDNGGTVFVDADGVRWKRSVDGAVNVQWFGAVADYVDEENKGTDNWEAFQSCYNFAAQKRVHIPAGQYSIGQTVIVPKGTLTYGDGVYSRWLNFAAGTVLRPMGAGNPAIWTDIDEGDDDPIRPLFVAGGQAVKFQNLSFVDQSDDPWDVAVFFPAVRQCSMFECVIFGLWDNAGLYLDATWGPDNTSLTSVHPEIEPQSMCEFNATNCYLGGKTAYKLQGTTRDTDGFTTNTFLWSPNGASDISFMGCQFRPSGGEGHACVWQDAAAINSAGGAQGQWFQHCAYRGGGSNGVEFTFYLDRCNRTHFQGYSENFRSEPAKVAITSRTGLVGFDGRFLSAGNLYIDGVDQGYILDPNLVRENNVMVYDMLGRQTMRVLTGPQDLELSAGSRDVVVDAQRFGNLQYQGENRFQITSVRNSSFQRISPFDDNSYNLGESDRRWGTGFFGSDPIVTSDGREKSVTEIPSAVLDAWGEVEYVQYRWLSAVDEKGEQARYHFGVIAQSIREAFERYGLNAFDYGLLCYDEWEEQEEIIDEWEDEYDEKGEIIRPAGSAVIQEFRPAGNRYSIRPAECHFLEAAYQRRKLARLEDKIAQLESKDA